MKRHPSLEPFSRDHNDGLILARRLDQLRAAALAEFAEAWEGELRDHFAEEERLLGPLCPLEAKERLLREHAEIEALGKSALTDEEARRLGDLLHDHIRWEERELFREIESRATSAALASLAHASIPLERRRGKANPKRAELVAKRPVPSESTAQADLKFLAGVSRASGPQWGMESEDLNATLLTWSQGQGIAEHINEEVDVLIVMVEGEVEVRIDGTVTRLIQGQMMAIPKGGSRSVKALTPRAAHLNVHKRRRKMMPL